MHRSGFMRLAATTVPSTRFVAVIKVLVLAVLISALPRSGKAENRQAAAFRALERYWQGAANHQPAPEATIPFRIDAELPRLHKRGMLRGLKVITGAGRVAYTQLQFVGDNLVKTAVIARYLSADTKLKVAAESAEVVPKNYRFLYKGTTDYDRRTAFVFATEPRQHRVGLFKGELWIDTETAQPLREWGEFAKSPSAFLKHVYFVRDYASSSTDPMVRRVLIRLQAAFAGPVELTMWFDDPAVPDAGEE